MKWRPGIWSWSVLLALMALIVWVVLHWDRSPSVLLILSLSCVPAIQFMVLAGRVRPEHDYAVSQERYDTVLKLTSDIGQLQRLHSSLVRQLAEKDGHGDTGGA